jgi:hypothetical protein
VTTTMPFRWTRQDSAELTAELIVAGAHMSAKGLDDAELRATVQLAHAKRVRRMVIARRIGWSKDHLEKWCRYRDLFFDEEGFPYPADVVRGARTGWTPSKRRPRT